MKIRVAKSGLPGPRRIPPDQLCNAKKKSGGTCRRPAGAGTDHLGQGRCRRHGGTGTSRMIVHGWYSQVTHHRIKDLLGRLTQIEMNAMDLIPEANLLRAMTIDYVNRYDQFVEALMAWYADPDSKQRPRRVMDIQDAAHLVESISRVVQRMHQIQSEGAISLETFQRVTEHMGMIVTKYVDDPLILNKIEKDWQDLAMDSKAPPPSTPDQDQGDR